MMMQFCPARNATGGLLLATLGLSSHVRADSGPVITDSYAAANGVKLHYLVAENATPSSCSMATRRTVTCGAR